MQYCRKRLAASTTARAVLINAGQANAATGEQGWQDSLASAAAVGKALGIPADSVLLESTGVIGQRIKMTEFMAKIPDLVEGAFLFPPSSPPFSARIAQPPLASIVVEAAGAVARMRRPV